MTNSANSSFETLVSKTSYFSFDSSSGEIVVQHFGHGKEPSPSIATRFILYDETFSGFFIIILHLALFKFSILTLLINHYKIVISK